MAKKKKAKAKAKPKRSPKKKAPRAKSSPKGKSSKKSGGTEVEKRWAEYWRCRKQLEEACESVSSAQEKLAEAMELERSRRTVFEETKKALELLLEVAPPSPTPSAPQRPLDLVSE